MKSLFKRLLSAAIAIGLCFVAFQFFNAKDDKERPIVEFNGTQVEVGKSTVKDILSKGYTIKGIAGGELLKSVPGKKYTSLIGTFEKEGISYGNISVANNSSVEQNLEDCTITQIIFLYTDSNSYFKDATINNINAKEMTQEQLKAKVTEHFNRESDNNLYYRSGHFDWNYEFKNGVLYSQKVEVDVKSLK
jgi:hypothetical protein